MFAYFRSLTMPSRNRRANKKNSKSISASYMRPYDPKRTGFFSLSPELRNRIYTHIATSMHTMKYAGGHTDQNTSQLTIWPSLRLESGQRTNPSIGTLSLVSKQFSREFRSVYFDSWESIRIVQGRMPTFNTSNLKFAERKELVSPYKLIVFIKLLGREAKDVRKFVVHEGTPVGWPLPKSKEVAGRMCGLVKGGEGEEWKTEKLELEEGQRIDVILTSGADIREYENHVLEFVWVDGSLRGVGEVPKL